MVLQRHRPRGCVQKKGVHEKDFLQGIGLYHWGIRDAPKAAFCGLKSQEDVVLTRSPECISPNLHPDWREPRT